MTHIADKLEVLLRGPDDRTQVLLRAVPDKARAVEEVAFVLVLVFGVRWLEQLAVGGFTLILLCVAVPLCAWAVRLLRPWRFARQGRWALAGGSALLCALLVTTICIIQLMPEQVERPRLGLQLENVEHPTDPSSGAARVAAVVEDSPAFGHVNRGDLIVAVNGQSLSRSDAAGDLAARSRDPISLPGPTATLRLIRNATETSVRLTVNQVQRSTGLQGRQFFVWLSVRNVALSLLVILLIWSDGQELRQLGLERRALGRELLRAPRVLGGAYLVHLAIAIPLGLLSVATGFGREDAVQRSGFLAQLGEGVGFFDLAGFLVLAAAFEEVVFRGFLLTRLFALVNRWAVAVLLGAVLFGVAHTDQGTLAVFQTAALGIYFAFAFLRRGRAEAVIIAHACFNLLMFGALFWLSKSGWLERAQQLMSP